MIEFLKEKIKEARRYKNGVTLNLLTTLLGDFQLESSRKNRELKEIEYHNIIKIFIKNLKESLKHVDSIQSIHSKESLPIVINEEISILEQLLPKTLSKKEIGEVLTSKCLDAIIGAKSKGQAMGIAMKTFKSLNLSVDGKDVEEAVNEMVN